MFFTPGGLAARRGSAFGHVVLSLTMDLNSSSDEEEDAPVAAPPQAKLAITDLTGGATTESMDVDEGNEEVLEVEVEAVWEADEEEEEEEELDPRVTIKMETGVDEQIRSLAAYLESRGGTRDMVDGWRARIEIRRGGKSAGTRNRCFFDPSGKRFRSHPEIARYFELEAAPRILHCLPSSAGGLTSEEGEDDEEGEDEQIRSLAAYLVSCGGTCDMVDGWRAETEIRRGGDTAGQSDNYFFDPSGKRFRSRLEVARHFQLEAAPHIRRRTCLPSSAASATTRAHAADTRSFTSAEEDPDIYEVERILGERRRGGRAQFLIRWLGCAPPTPRLAHASPRVACYTCDENGARRVTQG